LIFHLRIAFGDDEAFAFQKPRPSKKPAPISNARDGHQRVVRHGHLPEREVMTGIGPVAVRQPRVRDASCPSPDEAVAEIRDALGSIGDTCPECPSNVLARTEWSRQFEALGLNSQ
jgi:hypothetical protein